MNNLKPWVANTLWQISAYPAWVQFQRSSKKVLQTQQKLFTKYIHKNKDTAYGRRFSFSKIRTISVYQELVPLSTYDDYIEYIERIGNGESNVLSASQVRMLELSSGSTAPSKLIPYTNQLQSEFQSGIAPWIFDLFRNHPDLKSGTAYWSISPLSQGIKYTSAGIPIGFEEDSAYLGRVGKILVESVMAVPNQVKSVQDIDNFRYITLLFLLRNPNLRMMSVWNPTFLSLLLEPLPIWWEQLVDDIKEGSISPPKRMNNDTYRSIKKSLAPSPLRASQLSQIEPNDYIKIWLNLKLVSCWADGPSNPYTGALMELFPGVHFQGKGLIATEGFISFPLVNLPANPLAVNSHFFEFLPVENDNDEVNKSNPHLAHQLETGKKYSVVISTGGGFYRYQLQDIIEVIDYYHQVPLIRFVSKSKRISDRFGEKLSEGFVSSILQELFETNQLKPNFSMLAPNDAAKEFRYTLYLELPQNQLANLNQPELTESLDSKLCQNFHYAYCRELGQIAQVNLFFISHHAQQAYIKACQDSGQRLGDIKNTQLNTTSGWSNIFDTLPCM